MAARLTYSVLCSLDGYTADEDGDFAWAMPDEDVHRLANELDRGVGTHLYGRRMYETMRYWETEDPDRPTVAQEYAAIWRGADKIVYSRTLEEVTTARTRLEREFDPEAIRALKRSADHNLAIGGPELAAQALAAGLVDELSLFLFPQIIGGGTPALPEGLRTGLELREERRFGNGTVYLHYRVRT